MDTIPKNDFLGLSGDPIEVMGDIGILYDEFLDEAEKLIRDRRESQVLNVKKKFDAYTNYSQRAENMFEGNTSALRLRGILIEFRTRKENNLDHILKVCGDGIIPAILPLRTGTEIFKEKIKISFNEKKDYPIYLK